MQDVIFSNRGNNAEATLKFNSLTLTDKAFFYKVFVVARDYINKHIIHNTFYQLLFKKLTVMFCMCVFFIYFFNPTTIELLGK